MQSNRKKRSPFLHSNIGSVICLGKNVQWRMIRSYFRFLIEEIPGNSEFYGHGIDRIVGNQKIFPAITALVYVGGHNIKARVLEMHVGVNVNYRICANFCAVVLVLYGILPYYRRISGGVILRKEFHIASESYRKYSGYFEMEIKI